MASRLISYPIALPVIKRILSLGVDKTVGASLRNDRIVGEGVSKLLIKIKIIVRCCIYLTTYDWIKSFLKITIDTEPYMEI